MNDDDLVRQAFSETLYVKGIDTVKLYEFSIHDALCFMSLSKSVQYFRGILEDLLQKGMHKEAAGLLLSGFIKFYNHTEQQNTLDGDTCIIELLSTLQICLRGIDKALIPPDAFRVLSMILKRSNMTDYAYAFEKDLVVQGVLL